MTLELGERPRDCAINSISPRQEMGAYEALWLENGATFKTIADKFRKYPDALPSEFVPPNKREQCAADAIAALNESGIRNFGVRVHGAGEYPLKLRDARHPIEFLYYRGYWELVESRGVAVVGSRNPSKEGLARARRIAIELVGNDFTVISGLAKGIDGMAHRTAIEKGGRTLAVIGTPLSHSYPKEHAELQEEIATKFLVISQVPVLRYNAQTYKANRLFFPERNVTMSALSLATIIVEAGETSGTLTQARAALAQGRKLFILDSCFQNPAISWPAKFEKQGAIRVRDFEDISRGLS